jgi:hypothetical protein
MPRYSPAERVGVNAAEEIVVKRLHWIFREQPIVDVGIDAHIEPVEEGNPSGRLLAAQIKSGASHFKDKGDTLVYYGQSAHLDYWLKHSLPVIIIAHIPSTLSYWAHVTAETAERTKKAWKIKIPKTQIFDESCKAQLEQVLRVSQAERETNLRLALPLMRHIASGGRVLIYKEDWHNKLLGRGEIKIITQDHTGKEKVEKEWFLWYTGYDVKELIQTLFPWATIRIDQEFYEENFDESVYEVFTPGLNDEEEIYPYNVYCDEVSYYRLELSLNDLGKAFLLVADHVDQASDS